MVFPMAFKKSAQYVINDSENTMTNISSISSHSCPILGPLAEKMMDQQVDSRCKQVVCTSRYPSKKLASNNHDVNDRLPTS